MKKSKNKILLFITKCKLFINKALGIEVKILLLKEKD
jgi:hypothetical protein